MSENTYEATVIYAGDEFFIGIPPSGHAQTIDTKADRHAAPTPVEMLLVSVAGCTAADVVSILQKKRQDVTDYKVLISGIRKEEHPAAFIKFSRPPYRARTQRFGKGRCGRGPAF
jgi:putative redox protein